MKFGIRWYAGDGEHDYRTTGQSEYVSLHDLLEGLQDQTVRIFGEDLLFDALAHGPQETVTWITDDFGFAFYIPGRST